MAGLALRSLHVMAGLDPAIHASSRRSKDVDARVKPGHDGVEAVCPLADLKRYPLITPLATSRCQMNSTTTAPIVAMMKPAPWSGL
ncbi:MAG: hypothetical protein EKK33_20265 [Bradyrhizobiaceae bacterium]|jgi:hypothetical protein|nr:MAG: hypothetical protein EKK33_20265 [Bradyrhizobiaceae bacterium]